MATKAYSPGTREAARLLGLRVREARRDRRWTLQELADRVGVSAVTMRKVERGDLGVRLGVAFEAAAVLGIPLFHPDADRRRLEAQVTESRLAVLPDAVRKRRVPRDDF